MRVNIYIETSIRKMRRENGVVGFVLEAEGREGQTVTQFGKVHDVTEDQSILLGLKFALKRIRDKSDLVIWTESGIISSAINQNWVDRWIKSGWISSKGKEVANKKEWIEVVELLDGNWPKVAPVQQHSYKAWLKSEVERRANHVC